MAGEITPNLWPYAERSGDRAERDFAVLLEAPQVCLAEAEKQEVLRFQRGLFVGVMGDITCQAISAETGEVTDLEELDKTKVKPNERTYYPGYFETPSGKELLTRLDISTADELATTLQQRIARGEELDIKTLRTASVRSDKWYRSELIAQLGREPETDADFVEPQSLTVHFKPDELLDKFAAYKAYKEFYKQVGQALHEQPESAVRTAKQAWLNVYRGSLNYRMAALYPSMWKLGQQLAASDQTATVQHWAERLHEIAPIAYAAYRQELTGDQRRQRFIDGFGRRLDLLRQGAVYVAPGENYSPISPKLYELVASYNAEDPADPVMAAEVIETIQQTVWNSGQFKDFIEGMLGEQNLLSSERANWEEVEDRKGPAADGKWQAVISPKHDNLSTDSSKKIMIIPEESDRGLIQQDPSGPLAVGPHENVHVQQAEANEKLARTVPLAKIGGRRDLMLGEMGGVREEKAIFALLGIKRRINEYYLRGLQRKLDGGNIAEVIRTVHDLVLQTSSRQPGAATREFAVDRARRLYRYDGHNSQPLDYTEQELALRALEGQSDERVRAIAVALTALSPMDAAELHRVGALAVPDAHDIPISAHVGLKVYMDKFYDS